MSEEQGGAKRGVILESIGKEGKRNYTRFKKYFPNNHQNNTLPPKRDNSFVNHINKIFENFKCSSELTQNLPSSKKEIVKFLLQKLISKPRDVNYHEAILAILFQLGPITREPIITAVENINKIRSSEDIYKVEILSDAGIRIHGNKIAHKLWNKICKLESNSNFAKSINLRSLWDVFKENFEIRIASLGVSEVKPDLYKKIGDGTRRVPPDVIRAVGVIGDKQCLPALVRLYEKEKKESSYISTLIKSVVRSLIKKEKMDDKDPLISNLSEKEIQVFKYLYPKTIHAS